MAAAQPAGRTGGRRRDTRCPGHVGVVLERPRGAPAEVPSRQGLGGDRVQTVMYKGPAQALLDVMGGHVEFGVTPVAVGYPHVQAGKLKLIGIADTRPLPGLETAPLMSRAAPGLSIHGCWNLVLPPGTPSDIQKWYAEQFVPAIRSAEAGEKFRENMMYITPEEHTPQGVRAAMTQLQRTWQPIARRIRPE